MSDNYCKDCRWLRIHGFEYCERPGIRLDPVMGRSRVWAQTERSETKSDHCGPDAKFFEQRPELSLLQRARKAFF